MYDLGRFCKEQEDGVFLQEGEYLRSMNANALPPKAKKIDHIHEMHGDRREDPYFWLRERENPEVTAYLEAENTYLEQQLEPVKAFRESLFQEMKARIKEDDQSVPYFKQGYWFYTRYETGREYPIFCRKKDSLDADEEIMLDVNTLAEGHEYYHASGLSLSPDKRFLSFGVDTVSRRLYTLQVKDLQSGNMLNINIPNTTGYAAWSADGNYLFYTAKDEQTLRSCEIWRYGIADGTKEKVYTENDETFVCGVGKSKSDAYLIINCHSTLTTECLILEADQPEGVFKVFSPRTRGMEYGIAHYDNRFYVLTNWEAKNFRLMQCLETQTSRENWTEVIAHREDTLLEGVEIFSRYMVLDERRKGLTHLRIMDQKSGQEHYLDFGEETYSAGISVNPEYDTDVLRFGYTSMTTPSSTYDYNMNSREKTLLKQQEVLGTFEPSDYQAERRYFKARDGVEVPVSLVWSKEYGEPKNRPLLLYAYGSYGHSMDPYFSSVRLSLLDRGFIFALAHIRGGEDLGRAWYEDGKLLKKKNTFNDFIDCSEALIREGYTSAEKLCAMGGSAGGLLMGAVVNERPDLYKAVVAQVPFVDVVSTMLDDSIPLTTGEYDEWGNPNIPEYYHYMKSYSPYDNMKAQNYPNMLVTTGLHDSQVQYWEPAKWVARLREMKTDHNLLLLHTNMKAGHGGSSGRFEALKEVALEYAFLLMLFGLER